MRIKTFLESDHARCDAYFDQAQACVEQAEWGQASIVFQQFEGALEHHLAMEEEVLFPAFEQAMGHADGPTSVMRSEHVQLRRIVGDLNAALVQSNAAAFFAAAEVLQIMMGQHNLKEEGILYPMAEKVLRGRLDAVLDEMRALPEEAGSPLCQAKETIKEKAA